MASVLDNLLMRFTRLKYSNLKTPFHWHDHNWGKCANRHTRMNEPYFPPILDYFQVLVESGEVANILHETY